MSCGFFRIPIINLGQVLVIVKFIFNCVNIDVSEVHLVVENEEGG